eukprot:CAMPEP_0185846788 /NCGR_PEP_ID=MMETSP1354-20130828/2307_1 /TAXON_ID=708628 /ORGANISM="Erythrolobus madagascarensis, Strain CCMP3276" /LENGTH=192 /DNA_ID=CAMNT_0028546995 /DNA_START=46 /DNA_END=624 /DNA_ORIENTATION=+
MRREAGFVSSALVVASGKTRVENGMSVCWTREAVKSGTRSRLVDARSVVVAVGNTTTTPTTPAKLPIPPPQNGSNVRSVEEVEQLSEIFAEDENEIVCVNFHAKWCRKCTYLAPKLERISYEFPAVAFTKVDVNKARELSKIHHINHVPAIHFYKRGQLVHRVVGAGDGMNLPTKIRTYLTKITAQDTAPQA